MSLCLTDDMIDHIAAACVSRYISTNYDFTIQPGKRTEVIYRLVDDDGMCVKIRFPTVKIAKEFDAEFTEVLSSGDTEDDLDIQQIVDFFTKWNNNNWGFPVIPVNPWDRLTKTE